jgi:hypothetical protein
MEQKGNRNKKLNCKNGKPNTRTSKKIKRLQKTFKQLKNVSPHFYPTSTQRHSRKI